MLPCVILLVDNPEFLELHLAPSGLTQIPAHPGLIRAKIGLEHLQLVNAQATPTGWLV